MAAVVQQNELVFEFASNVMEDEQQVWDAVRNHIRTSWFWVYCENMRKKCVVEHKKANIEVIIVAADLSAVSKASCCFL